MFFRFFLIMLLIPSLAFAANYYVDPTYDGSNGSPNGSFLRPWTNISGQVASYSFSTGDRLYFKSGTVTPMNAHLSVNWHGTAENRVIIGTYFDENNFGNGNVHPDERAVLDGQNFLVPTSNTRPMIRSVNHQGYVTIQDLEIRDSGGSGIIVGNLNQGGRLTDYNYHNQYYIIQNNYINRPWSSAMTIARSNHNQILNNTTYRSSHGNQRTHPHRRTNQRITGAAIEITPLYIDGLGQHNFVSGNTVSMSAYEGIGFYKGARYGTIANNVVYDCSVNIYIGSARDIDIYGNIIYGTSRAYRGSTAAGFNSVRNIILQHEWTTARPQQRPIENVRIFGNYIAGGHRGIAVSKYSEITDFGWKNVEIFNNTLVDNQANFAFNNADNTWENNYIYGNYSFNYDDRLEEHIRHDQYRHLDPPASSPYSFTWNRAPDGTNQPNYFTGGTMPNGNAGQSASLNNAHLAKKTGWSVLTQGEVTVKYFSLEGGAKTAYGENQKSEPEKVKNVMIIEGGVVN